MFWVDEIADEIIQKNPQKKEMFVRDEKTLSGRVHVGSLRGVVLHGVIAQALRERGIKAHFVYEFNDVDPMDGLPVYLDKSTFGPHMGKPLRHVPSPDKSAKNLPEFFGNEFRTVIDSLGLETEYTLASKKYDAGEYDEWIVKAMENEAEIRRIYREVSGSEKPEDWHPLQVVCENCGKVGTTKVTAWDGEMAAYNCEPNMVKWAEGCGHTGKIKPFKGAGKLPWKVEWPVKWATYNVDVEGAGKDHNAAGGSYDVGRELAEKVFNIKVPFGLHYEFFLFGGAKMSSSKGEGAMAAEIAKILPPELIRFLMIRSRPNQPIEFDPNDETIPRLFDRYDECADHHYGTVEEVNKDFARAFYFSQVSPDFTKTYRPRFSRLVFMVQVPHLNIEEEVAKLKGSPLTKDDKKELENRLHYVRLWLEEYAPESVKFEVQNEVPRAASVLTQDQKDFLSAVVAELKKDYSGEELHAKIHELRKNSPLQARDAFAAIYLALIGKDSGPQAGWFLEALDRGFVMERLESVIKLEPMQQEVFEPFDSELLRIDADVLKRFPGVKSAWLQLTGVKIGKNHPDITEKITHILGGKNWSELKNSQRLEAYKEMYRDFGVNPNKSKPSPVMLVERLSKGKDFPRVNDVVDAYNYIVIKHQISAGAFDANAFIAPVTLRFSAGGERFQGIGEKEKILSAGELCYFDAEGLCITRDLNSLDSELTKITEFTTDLYLNLDAPSIVSSEAFEVVCDELLELVQSVCGGKVGKRVIFSARFSQPDHEL